ncbi:cohesin domain-containing protein [Paenibacillus sp. N3.4]|uniref:cohesin domain-containing protein n=1 Tax=Paenibacillus sp. N3.4 TaxID=2603222 RepID=UPI0011CC91CA|nr:cohesin domain-containing protein [Paenibacillus sp. N3.4]TXK84408.1 hypothetical protein FU659_09305 [Paenibacillus sp. N3.4]
MNVLKKRFSLLLSLLQVVAILSVLSVSNPSITYAAEGDGTLPASPTLTTADQTVNTIYLRIKGTATPGDEIFAERDPEDYFYGMANRETGAFDMVVLLEPNRLNKFSIYAVNSVGVKSKPRMLNITHKPVEQDQTPPNAPTLATSDQTTNADYIRVKGTTAPGLGILVENRLEQFVGIANKDTGAFEVIVPLELNAVNRLSVYAVSAAGVKSGPVTLIISQIISDQNIKGVTNPADKAVPHGTSFSQLGLPAEVTVTLDNNTTAQIPVIWAASSYNGNTAGAYTLTGTLHTLPKGISNIDGLTAQVKVLVGKPAASNDAALSGIKVNDTGLSGFNKDTLAYNVELPSGTTAVPNVTAVSADAKATVVITPAAGLPGTTKIGVTAEDGITKQTYTINFSVKAAPQKMSASLSGTNSVMEGQSFSLIYGLQHLNDSIYAHDLLISYDPNKVEYVSSESLINGLKIVSEKGIQEKGLRILAASLGEDGAVKTDSDLLKLNFKAKYVSASTQTSISLSNAAVSNGDGVETKLEDVFLGVQITHKVVDVVDKTALNSAIAGTQTAHDAAVEGTGVGQYPAGAKAKLMAAIEAAEAVAGNASATQQQVDQATAKLNEALQVFKDSVLTRIPGDLNGDGKITVGDLAIAVSYYGKDSTDPQWDTYKIADLNGDGIIDIVDLAAIARKIFNLID